MELGFELVGVTGPEPPDHLEVYDRWLAQGRHGQMGYLATHRAVERRGDPRRILPECRSIVVVGANCLPQRVMGGEQPGRPQDSGPGEAARGSAFTNGTRTTAGGAASPRVAAYAVGQDYHDLLPQRLGELVRSLESQVGRPIAHRIYSDTGPLLERELAQRAGLGWIGKNTCLIHPRLGSHFLLAEVLLDLELVPDAPLSTDHCGSCTRCLEACPTGCILPDRTLQADRCISYLTIELRGEIPRDLRPQVGDWLFGCDICQQVCPWNLRFAAPTLDPAFQPRPWLRQAGLDDWLELGPETYREQLRGSPLKRPRQAGLLRNATVVAGNRSDPSLVPALRSLLQEAADPLVRAHAAWALGRIRGAAAQEALRSAAEIEPDPRARQEIARGLGEA
jgi:epoxyqueuosine reductase